MFRFLIIFLILCAKQVGANETSYGSFFYSSDFPKTLFFLGDIEYGQSFELRKALRNHDIENIVLASDGGSVAEGLLMAGIIFDKQLRTYIPKDTNCQSACSYMFFAGDERLVDGRLGVHQTWSTEYDKKQNIGVTQLQTQYTVSEIIGFLNEFGTPQFVYEKMFQDREMYYFDQSELAKLNSEVFGIDRARAASLSTFSIQKLKSLRASEEYQPKPEPKLTQEDAVRIIQTRLNEIGCNAGPSDGIWGKRTEAAAKLFAKKAGLPTEGDDWISEEFLTELEKAPQNYCPKVAKPKQKTLHSLSGNWTGSLYCQNERYPARSTSTKRSSYAYSFTLTTANFTYVGVLNIESNGKDFSVVAVDNKRREFNGWGRISSNGTRLNGQTKTCTFHLTKF